MLDSFFHWWRKE